MLEDFTKLSELLQRTRNQYSIRFLGNTELGDCWSCSFKPFWDNGNRHTLFDRSLGDLIPRVYDIIIHDEPAKEAGSMRDELDAV